MDDEPKARIMIVDDERLNINILNNILKDHYHIKVATCGEQALLRANSDPRPDMILLDIRMPDIDGYQVCKRLKENPDTEDIPVIFITTLAEDEDEERGLALGAVDYITKPLRPSIIQARIKTHLGLKRAQESLALRNSELQEMLVLRESVEQIARHDLKSPLNGILGVTQLLSEESYILPEHQEMIALQERAGYRMLEMINSSLDILKMEMGNYALHLVDVDLLRIIRRIMRELKHASTILLLNGYLVGDEDRFIIQGEDLLCYSMLSNLIKNAVEQSAPDESVTISLTQGEQSGISGITIHNPAVVPQSVRDHFFEKYITEGKATGTGLGTYSAKLIAETLGGEIAMQTSESDGTTITLQFPRQQSGSASSDSQSRSHENGSDAGDGRDWCHRVRDQKPLSRIKTAQSDCQSHSAMLWADACTRTTPTTA